MLHGLWVVATNACAAETTSARTQRCIVTVPSSWQLGVRDTCGLRLLKTLCARCYVLRHSALKSSATGMINAAREGLRKSTKVAELDASTFLAREPYNLSLSLAGDVLSIISKPKGLHDFFRALKTQVLSAQPRMP